MKVPAFVRAAAVVLSSAFLAGGVLAVQPQNEPAVLSDAQPLPAQLRDSIGAVILMDDPVIAQREMMQQALARHTVDVDAVDTRAMGAAPSRVLPRAWRDLLERSDDDKRRKPRH